MKSELRITSDGSATLFVPELNEHYHSINGAVQESEHIFIGMGLKSIPKKEICVFELGFGTGLNTMLTLLQEGEKSIVYHAMELYPLDWITIEQLGYEEFLSLSEEHRTFFERIHKGPWGYEITIRPDFSLTKINESILNSTLKGKYDLVYFDAFAPEVQPELWKESVFSKLYNAMNTDGKLVTYCAKGEVRRRLQRVGFSVERLPGPLGKREVLRAIKLQA